MRANGSRSEIPGVMGVRRVWMLERGRETWRWATCWRVEVIANTA